jgi:DNA helicase-2/ATP-dependent DNA helicase PcrA
VNFVRKTIAYDDYIKKHCMEYGINHDELFNILDEYEVSASGFKSIPDFLSHINEVSLKLKKDDKANRHYTDSVTLSTIHGAKGLEFPFVYIIGCIEGCMPHSKCMITGENIEEERRLLYVAVTRAKTNLIISSPRKHHGKIVQPSRFLDEISEVNNKHNQNNLILTDFRTGDLISHRTFGTGKIIKIDGKSMDIKFNGRIGIKTLDIKICIENKLVEK